MARFVKGDVVVALFPFSNAIGAKVRPALVLGHWPCGSGLKHTRTDYLVCAISTHRISTPYVFDLQPSDLTSGTLDEESFLRPTYLFTAEETVISRRMGTMKPEVVARAVGAIKDCIDS